MNLQPQDYAWIAPATRPTSGTYANRRHPMPLTPQPYQYHRNFRELAACARGPFKPSKFHELALTLKVVTFGWRTGPPRDPRTGPPRAHGPAMCQGQTL